MNEQPLYVVDATIVGKWFLRAVPTEDYTHEAEAVRRHFNEGRLTLTAPYHIRYEVPSIVTKAVGAGRIPNSTSEQQLIQFFLYFEDVPTPRDTPLSLAAHRLAVRYRCTYYDGLYLALAERHSVPFIHADGRLRRSLNGGFPFELWIEDYQPQD